MKINKVLLSNIFSLLILQGTSYLLPLLTLPYLVRILGGGNFGLMIFSSALIQYLVVICDFGFNYTATQKVSLARGNKKELDRIFSRVFTVKIIMMLLSFILMILIVFCLPMYRHYILLFVVNFLTVIGNTLFPIWFFQGIENMKVITIINVISKCLATVSIFLFVKETNDVVLATALQSSGFLIAGIFGLIIALKRYRLKIFFIFNLKDLKEEFMESWKVFVSTLSINIYNQGSIIILGLFVGNTVLGYYGVAQKIIHAIIGLCQPFAQSIYPILCKIKESDFGKYTQLVNRIKLISIISSFVLALLTCFNSSFITKLIAGSENLIISDLVAFWTIILFFIINNIIFNTFVLSMKKYDQMQKMYVHVSVIFLIISIPLTYFLKEWGMSISMLFVEGFIFIGSLRITRFSKGMNFLKLDSNEL